MQGLRILYYTTALLLRGHRRDTGAGRVRNSGIGFISIENMIRIRYGLFAFIVAYVCARASLPREMIEIRTVRSSGGGPGRAYTTRLFSVVAARRRRRSAVG